jgi:hypothetical protein
MALNAVIVLPHFRGSSELCEKNSYKRRHPDVRPSFKSSSSKTPVDMVSCSCPSLVLYFSDYRISILSLQNAMLVVLLAAAVPFVYGATLAAQCKSFCSGGSTNQLCQCESG